MNFWMKGGGGVEGCVEYGFHTSSGRIKQELNTEE